LLLKSSETVAFFVLLQ